MSPVRGDNRSTHSQPFRSIEMESTEFLGDVDEAEAIEDTASSSSYDDDNDDQVEETCGENEQAKNSDKPEHDRRVQILLEANQEKEKRLELLQKELNHHKVQHKEGIYWLQLQLDTARREKDAAEERMAELQGDLKHMVQLPPESSKEENDGKNTDGHHRAQLQKYETAVLSLENQVAMVKTSFSEINRSLKEEICDLMEDRTQVELDLLNQMSDLDAAKRETELQFTLQLERKDEEIELLRQQNNYAKVIADNPPLVEEMKQEINHLRLLKRQAEQIIERERIDAEDVMDRLEGDDETLKHNLEAAEGDLVALKSASNKEIANSVLEQVTEERIAIVSSLNRLAKIWEMADASVLSLKVIIDKFRLDDDTKISFDGERMLSTLELASLLHAEIKLSLDLIELKLRNGLECIEDDKLTTSWTTPIDQEVNQKCIKIHNKALTALVHLEQKFSQEMRRLEKGALGEVKQLMEGLKERSNSLAELQKNHNELEAEISRLKKSNHDSDGFVGGSFLGDAAAGDVISGSVLDQLQTEVIRIVARIQDKNETIASLKETLTVHKHREVNLRRELKRAIRANTAMYESPKKEAVKIPSSKINKMSNSQQPKKQQNVDSNSSDKDKPENPAGEPKTPAFVDISSPSKIRRESTGHRVPDSRPTPAGDISSPSNMPAKAKAQLQLRRNSTGQRTVDSTIPLETPPGSIRPLQPSRREIFKARHSPHSPLLVKALAFSPLKSPTSVDGQL